MTTLNVYDIPVDSRTTEEYFEFVTSLPFQFNNDRSLVVDPYTGVVKVDGSVAGYTLTGTEEV